MKMIKNDIHELYNWILKSTIEIDKVNEVISNYAETLPVYPVEIRKSIIK